jgi:large subunit ribosomal protein L9
MQVILLERVAKLGQMGEVVNVKDGYARNYLLPQKKALWASESNIKAFEGQKAQLEADNLETKKEAEALAGKLDGQQFIVIRSASDAGALYGSVTTRDAADAATEAGFSVNRKQIVLSRPIKELGLHELTVSLHPEVDVVIVLNVARSQEEAELQAAGKSIQELAAEEEAEAEFEIAELFDDIGAAQLDELEAGAEDEGEDADVGAKGEADAPAEEDASADDDDNT